MAFGVRCAVIHRPLGFWIHTVFLRTSPRVPGELLHTAIYRQMCSYDNSTRLPFHYTYYSSTTDTVEL